MCTVLTSTEINYRLEQKPSVFINVNILLTRSILSSYNQHLRDVRFNNALPLDDDKDIITQLNSIRNHNAVSCSVEVFNNSDRPIVVGFGDGTKYISSPRFSQALRQGVYILKRYIYSPSCTTISPPPKSGFELEDKLHDKLILLLKTESAVPGFNPYNTSRIVEETYYFDNNALDDLTVNYFGNLNIVISTDLSATWHHPLTPSGISSYMMRGIQAVNRRDMFSLNIQIVVPQPNLTFDRFINLYVTIYKIPVIYDPLKEPGVYILDNQQCTDILKETKPWMARYDLAELNKPRKGKDASKLPMPIYATHQEALINGNQEAILEQEFKERVAQLERERLELKHKLEIKQMERKETNEVIKWIPTLISGLLSLATFFLKPATK